MKYEAPLIEAILLKRYKRFLADVKLPSGEVVVAHCPNSGSMKGCWEPGAPCRITHNDNPKRKLKYTLEQVRMGPTWIMLHTGRPNGVVAEAIEAGAIPELRGYDVLQREKKYGSENSRIDILLLDGGVLPPGTSHSSSNEQAAKRAAYVEVKNVTLEDGGVAWFPDSVTTRGTKHLRELMQMVKQGHRGVLFFHVGRGDCAEVRPAETIDPTYARTLRDAAYAGVEILAYQCEVNEVGLRVGAALNVVV